MELLHHKVALENTVRYPANSVLLFRRLWVPAGARQFIWEGERSSLGLQSFACEVRASRSRERTVSAPPRWLLMTIFDNIK